MAYYKGSIYQDSNGNECASCSGRYGSTRVCEEGGSGRVVVQGRNGKRYAVFLNPTDNGNAVGMKDFPRTFVKVVRSDKNDAPMFHVWIKSLATRRKMRTRYRRGYRRGYGNGYSAGSYGRSFRPRRRRSMY